MAIDWVSFFIGMAVGIIILNCSTLISAYLKYKGAKKAADQSEAKLNEIAEQLKKKEQELIRKMGKGSK